MERYGIGHKNAQITLPLAHARGVIIDARIDQRRYEYRIRRISLISADSIMCAYYFAGLTNHSLFRRISPISAYVTLDLNT